MWIIRKKNFKFLHTWANNFHELKFLHSNASTGVKELSVFESFLLWPGPIFLVLDDLDELSHFEGFSWTCSLKENYPCKYHNFIIFLNIAIYDKCIWNHDVSIHLVTSESLIQEAEDFVGALSFSCSSNSSSASLFAVNLSKKSCLCVDCT